jgi:hypothetical protein
MIQDYWTKQHDFVPLQDAGTFINQALRNDEENADLYRKIAWQGSIPMTMNNTSTSNISSSGSGGNNSSSSNTGGASHLYFPYDPNSTTYRHHQRMNGMSSPTMTSVHDVPLATPSPPPPEQTVQHIQSVPLPSLLTDQLQKVRIYSSMGLFQPASSHLAYLIVDHQLFVWSYEDQLVASYQKDKMNDTMLSTSSSASQSIISFAIPSGQCIISVGLVRPRQGTVHTKFFR